MNKYNSYLSNQSHAGHVFKKSKADGIALFLLNNNSLENPISFIYKENLQNEIIKTYSEKLYLCDPLIPHGRPAINKHPSPSDLIVKENPYRYGDYWKFLSHQGYRETASGFMPVSHNIFLVLGLNIVTKNKHLSMDAAINNIEIWLKESRDFIIESSVRKFFEAEVHQRGTPKGNYNNITEQLTNRENQVVNLLIQGHSNKLIADKLSLSEYTIENYLGKIYKKLNVKSRTKLMALLAH